MPRYIRNSLILVKNETTIGTDAAPTGAADAMYAFDIEITPLEAQNINRDLIRGYFGGSEQLVGSSFLRMRFSVELAGSGVAANAPQWGAPLLSCSVAESLLSTPSRVEYLPISTAQKASTIYWYDDGVLHKGLGAMGNARVMARAGDRAKLQFDFICLDGGISAASTTNSRTAPPKPVALVKSNVVDLTLGCTYAAGALSGGTVYNSTGLELDFGNAVNFNAMLTTETVDITDRSITGSIQLELTAAQEVTFMSTVKANTTQGVGFTIGTAAGNKVILFMPAVQLINPTKAEMNGKRLNAYQMRVLPSAGNDELRIVTQ